MAVFSQRIISDDIIDVPADALWAVLVDTECLAALTPLVASIDEQPDRWRWQLAGVTALGVTAAPTFTTVMTVEETAMAFAPEPGTDERATATGRLEVASLEPRRSRIAIDLVASVDLPLPSVMRRAVTGVMFQVMSAGGTRFANNLLTHLGDPPHRGLDVRRSPASTHVD